ncbi:4-diphosphocytidyl-2C-methyl-D-erythritol synthase [Longimycelium tulufanense]|uniref:4-diphosphocytidyl-2C-methyl-D-erythritol synthase n=1 Tax=Longimycelium tulufanense TaxID=907463 RepID=A0A8J3C6I9_9PSEU|nr:nucleotidyltransferase family protein [Longimycelium tulufanense]GGM40865.1 4-diphosphocytidyl-2C-methyl-D-erythritol synthase [Longimycelium tulufanense]
MTVPAGLVLAAGAGRRFGMPKALVRYRGSLLVTRAAEVLRAGGCDPVVVVLGAAAEEVRARAPLAGCVIVDNPNWPTGMGSSLRVGLGVLGERPAVPAVVVLPVDMPGVTPNAVRRLVAHSAPGVLAAASYHGERGHPVLLGREHWAGVRAAAVGDSGAREYLRQHELMLVQCEDVADGADADRPEDLPDG